MHTHTYIGIMLPIIHDDSVEVVLTYCCMWFYVLRVHSVRRIQNISIRKTLDNQQGRRQHILYTLLKQCTSTNTDVLPCPMKQCKFEITCGSLR